MSLKSHLRPNKSMPWLVRIVALLVVACAAGCGHTRFVAAANAQDCGERIRTRFRYRLFCSDADRDQSYQWANVTMYEKFQPDVFRSDGIPVALKFDEKLINGMLNNDLSMLSNLSGLFMLCTCGVVPSFSTGHSHRKCTMMIAGKRFATVEACIRQGESGAFPIPMPFPVLVFSGEGETCFASGRKFTLHSYDFISGHYMVEVYGMAMAYGIASRLKEAEDAGLIDERFSTLARSSQALSDAASVHANVVADDMARHGRALSVGNIDGGKLFDVVRCDPEQGKDFAYLFTLRKRGGGPITLSDHGVIRNAFRYEMRERYTSSHPNVNPRALKIAFTEYAVQEGVAVGRVAVLSISAESLSYDPVLRKGVIRVRIGEGQFEDARRWIRRNLVSLAKESNIVVGESLPKGGRFYSEREEMRDGVLEVAFKTE